MNVQALSAIGLLLVAPSLLTAQHPALTGIWFSVEGRRIWEFHDDGQLLSYPANAKHPAKQELRYRLAGNSLSIWAGERYLRGFSIQKLNEQEMRVCEEETGQTRYFVGSPPSLAAGELSRQLTNRAYQAYGKRHRKVIVFQDDGDFLMLENSSLQRFHYRWHIQNIAGFSFLFIDDEMHSIIMELNKGALHIGQLTQPWTPKVYEQIHYDLSKTRKDLAGNWQLGFKKHSPALELKLRRSGRGIWKPLSAGSKPQKITWQLEQGIPILKITKSKDQYLELLILKFREDELLVEELNTLELRGEIRKMYGWRR